VIAVAAATVTAFACWGATASAATLKWSAATAIDPYAPSSNPATFYSASCPDASLCFAGGPNDFYASRHPGSARSWVLERDPLGEINDLSCPTTSLCVGLDAVSGALATTRDPASRDPAWHEVRFSQHDAPFVISCPSRSLCVAVTGFGAIETSTDPTGGRGAWKLVKPGGGSALDAISCPTTHLCIAAGNTPRRFEFAASTDPTGGARAWHLTGGPRLPSMESLLGLSCPSAVLCVAGTNGADILSSAKPLSGGWRLTKIPSATQIDTVSCVSTTSCFAGDEFGKGVSSSAPAAGRWRRAQAPGLLDVTCADASLCVGVTQGGPLAVSRAPDTGRWQNAIVEGSSDVLGLACPTSTECVAIDNAGKILSSADPGTGAAAWRALNFGIGVFGSEDEPGNSGDIVCPSASLCVTGDNGEILVSRNPLGSSSAWHSTNGLDDEDNSVAAISCPSAAFCMALDAEEDGGGQVLVSSAPSSNAHAWIRSTWPAGNLGPVACASSTLCIVGSGSTLYVTTDPGATAPSWNPIHLPKAVVSLACPGVGLCVGTDSAHDVVSATQPAVASSWRQTTIPGGAGPSISCPTTSFCATAGGDGVSSSTDPGAQIGWTRQTIPHAFPVDLSVIACASARFCVASGRDGETTIGKP
jgi:hypothetical protein